MKYGAIAKVNVLIGVTFGFSQLAAKCCLAKYSGRVLYFRILRRYLKMCGKEIDLRLNESSITMLKLNNILLIVNLYVHVRR